MPISEVTCTFRERKSCSIKRQQLQKQMIPNDWECCRPSQKRSDFIIKSRRGNCTGTLYHLYCHIEQPALPSSKLCFADAVYRGTLSQVAPTMHRQGRSLQLRAAIEHRVKSLAIAPVHSIHSPTSFMRTQAIAAAAKPCIENSISPALTTRNGIDEPCHLILYSSMPFLRRTSRTFSGINNSIFLLRPIFASTATAETAKAVFQPILVIIPVFG